MVRNQDKLDLHDKTLSTHSEEINCIKKDMSKNNFWASFFGQNSWVQKFAKFVIYCFMFYMLIKMGYDASDFLSVLITDNRNIYIYLIP